MVKQGSQDVSNSKELSCLIQLQNGQAGRREDRDLERCEGKEDGFFFL